MIARRSTPGLAPIITLPSDAVGVVLMMGQSNTDGVGECKLSDGSRSTLPPWGANQFTQAKEWDKVRRSSAHSYESSDQWQPATVSGDDGVHKFRNAGTNWGRGGEYHWASGGGAVGTITYSSMMLHTLASRTRRPVYGIRCAKGSTGIHNAVGSQNWNLSASATTTETSFGDVSDSLWSLARDKYWKDGIGYLVNELGVAADKIHLLAVVWWLGAHDSTHSVGTTPVTLTEDTPDGADSATVCIDSLATYQTDGVAAGDFVTNVTDGSWATVVSVDLETQMTTTALVDGTDNLYQSGDTITVDNTSSANYEANLRDLMSIASSGSGVINNNGVRHYLAGDGLQDSVPMVFVRPEPYFRPPTSPESGYDQPAGIPQVNNEGIINVRDAIVNIVADMPNSVMVSSDAWAYEADGVHGGSWGEHLSYRGAMHAGMDIACAIEHGINNASLVSLIEPNYS